MNIHRSGVLTALAWLVPHETAAVSAQVLCTPYNHAPCHFMQSHIRKVYACLAVICHLHFWQNDRDLLRTTAVTRGWNGYRNKSQHRKSTPEKKILPPLQQGFEPETFQSRVWRSNHWAIPVPRDMQQNMVSQCKQDLNSRQICLSISAGVYCQDWTKQNFTVWKSSLLQHRPFAVRTMHLYCLAQGHVRSNLQSGNLPCCNKTRQAKPYSQDYTIRPSVEKHSKTTSSPSQCKTVYINVQALKSTSPFWNCRKEKSTKNQCF